MSGGCALVVARRLSDQMWLRPKLSPAVSRLSISPIEPSLFLTLTLALTRNLDLTLALTLTLTRRLEAEQHLHDS